MLNVSNNDHGLPKLYYKQPQTCVDSFNCINIFIRVEKPSKRTAQIYHPKNRPRYPTSSSTSLQAFSGFKKVNLQEKKSIDTGMINNGLVHGTSMGNLCQQYFFPLFVDFVCMLQVLNCFLVSAWENVLSKKIERALENKTKSRYSKNQFLG